MSRGKKLDLAIGASFEDDWVVVDDTKSPPSNTLKKPNEHTLVFQKQKRKGKTVTLVGEFFVEKKEAQKLLKQLKALLACGGSFKDGWMEFQGEVLPRLKELLRSEGYRFKN